MPPREAPVDQQAMSLGEHLDELRRRLIWCLAAPVPLAIVILCFSRSIINWLSQPAIAAFTKAGVSFQLLQLGPAEVVIQQLKLSIIGSILLSAPWILWQAWQFIRPGLYAHERRFAQLLMPLSIVLTIAASAFTFLVMLPVMLTVLVMLSAQLELPGALRFDDPRVAPILEANPSPPALLAAPTDPAAGSAWLLEKGAGRELYVALAAGDGRAEVVRVALPGQSMVTQSYQLGTYISFVLLMLFGSVISFQMPLVVMLLGWVDLVSVAWLRSKRRHALLVLAVVAAVVTPSPDPFSMMIMLLPLYGLFELGIVLLILAPARRVAAGTVFSLQRSDKSVARSAQIGSLSQPARPAPDREPGVAPSPAGSDEPGSGP